MSSFQSFVKKKHWYDLQKNFEKKLFKVLFIFRFLRRFGRQDHFWSHMIEKS